MITAKKQVIVIGGGFASLSSACYLAKAGYSVTLLEKNKQLGGRAQQLKRDGFTFDMGPTFYWMPDVFEHFFNDFNTSVSEFYDLKKLNPAYQVYFENKESISIADNLESIKATFEKHEKGSAEQLQKFIDNAESNYNIAIKDLVYQPGENIFEIINLDTAKKLGLFFTSIKTQVAQHIKNKSLQKILEFPVLFLGATPENTPAFYNFMNYADFALGTWHPIGGMHKVVEAMQKLALKLGVKVITDCGVSKINTEGKKVTGVETTDGSFNADIILSGADYHFTETLLPKSFRSYSENYWEKKTFAPSALLFYVGFNKKLKNVSHHTLFFDTNFQVHSKSIYTDKKWPEKPLFYASFPSITDNTAAPESQEAGIFLIPIAVDLEDTPEIREQYFETIMTRLEELTNQTLKDEVLFKESFCVADFKSEYNSYKGNAYGLANTLLQTHLLRPKLKSKKLENLYFTGQLTVPGPGVPPSIISGKIVSTLIQKYHESTI